MVLKLTVGCGMKNRKSHVTDVTRRTATLTRRDRDKHSEWGGIAGLSQKLCRDAGLKKPLLDPLNAQPT